MCARNRRSHCGREEAVWRAVRSPAVPLMRETEATRAQSELSFTSARAQQQQQLLRRAERKREIEGGKKGAAIPKQSGHSSLDSRSPAARWNLRKAR